MSIPPPYDPPSQDRPGGSPPQYRSEYESPAPYGSGPQYGSPPPYALGVRRLHDANFSGWLVLLSLVPIVVIAFVVLTILPSSPEGRRFDRVAV